MAPLTPHWSTEAKLTITSMLLCSYLFNSGAQSAPCKSPPEATFTVELPKVGAPPDDEGQHWSRPDVWEGHSANKDSITVPNGRPIYALIVSGFGSNRYLDELMVYNFARHLMAEGAYVHYAWWNNLLAPYMERPLHSTNSHPGGLSAESIGDFQTAEDAANKAVPGEDYQFLADAKRFLSAIREHNPSAMIIVVGHSMGGGAVVHLGSQSGVLIDILAPIDAVGNRNYPWSGPAALLGPVSQVKPYTNWTRWRVTRDNFLGFKSWQYDGPGNGCAPGGDWLKDIGERHNDVLCALQDVYYDNAPAVRFGRNIINLHYRYQKENRFPFDYDQDYHFGHNTPPGGTNSQQSVDTIPEFCGSLFNRCADPGGWPNTLDLSSPCCQSGDGVGWPKDGHGEIVGYRGPIPHPVPLGVRVRTSPQCGDCLNQIWPARSQADDGTWRNGNGTNRAALLQALELLPAGSNWVHRPVKPDLCLVSQGLIDRFDIMNKPPVANAGADQFIECPGPNGAEVILDGSGSSDPDNDSLTYEWTWASGSAQDVRTAVSVSKGTNCFALTVRDPSGHVASDVTTVVVQDTTPPNLQVSLTPRLLWPANHRLKNIHATVQANDGCGEVTSLTLVSIASNQPNDGRGDGNTGGDIEAAFNTLDLSFKLRAERAGPACDRIYTVTYEATDDSGNRAEVSDYVIVPHDANSYKNWARTMTR